MTPHAITPSQPSEAVERQDAPHGSVLPILYMSAVLGALVTALIVVIAFDADGNVLMSEWNVSGRVLRWNLQP